MGEGKALDRRLENHDPHGGHPGMTRLRRILVGLETLMLALLLLSSSTAAAKPADVPIDHIIVIYEENRPFDHLYGEFPGANGLDRPGAKVTQVDRDGEAYRTLPQPLNHGEPHVASLPKGPDKRFPDDLPNAPSLSTATHPRTS